MRSIKFNILVVVIFTSLLSCKVQQPISNLSEDISKILHAVLVEIDDEEINLSPSPKNNNLNFGLGAYENYYKLYLKTNKIKPSPRVWKATSWALNKKDISEISEDISSYDKNFKWSIDHISDDRVKIFAPSDKSASWVCYSVSKPFFNHDRNKAIIFTSLATTLSHGSSYVLALEKKNEKWRIEVRIEL